MQLINTANGQFVDGVPNQSNGTLLTAAWCNSVQAELAAVAQATGATLNSGQNNQVLTAIEQLIEARAGNYASDTGIANAYVVALSPALTAYTKGVPVQFRAANANTGPSTVDAGPGPVPLLRDDGSPVAGGDITQGSLVSGVYDPTVNGVVISAIVASQVLALASITYRYNVPLMAPYPTMPAGNGFVGDVPVSTLGKSTAQAVYWPFTIAPDVNLAKPIKLRIHYTSTIAGGNFLMQLGYQVFNGGSLTPPSYTNVQEAIPAPATAAASMNYLTAVAVIPASALALQGLIMCIVSRQPSNSLDTCAGVFQIVNIRLEQ
jgi:hypothetical protein